MQVHETGIGHGTSLAIRLKGGWWKSHPQESTTRYRFVVLSPLSSRGSHIAAMMTRSARAIPRGTVFLMNDGQLYMAKAGMFDRAGNFMAGGR